MAWEMPVVVIQSNRAILRKIRITRIVVVLSILRDKTITPPETIMTVVRGPNKYNEWMRVCVAT
jgi:hypothetical protein